MQKHLFILITSINVLALILAFRCQRCDTAILGSTSRRIRRLSMTLIRLLFQGPKPRILIATSSRVSDLAHLEAAYQFGMIMQLISPAIAARIREKKVLCILIGHDELTSQLPQFKSNKTGKELDFYNWRSRGFLTRKNNRPTVVFAEEDVLEFEGGMQLESILIHEFGHVVHGAGFDSMLQDRLTECFEAARQNGIWKDGRAAQRFRRVKSKTPVSLFDAIVQAFPRQSPALIKCALNGGDVLVNGKPVTVDAKVTGADKVLIMFGGPKDCYASKNRAEYWAEGFQCWYDTNRTMDHDHNHIKTREQLKLTIHLLPSCVMKCLVKIPAICFST